MSKKHKYMNLQRGFNEKLKGWATISEKFDKCINFLLKAAFQKRHGFAQSLQAPGSAVLLILQEFFNSHPDVLDNFL